MLKAQSQWFSSLNSIVECLVEGSSAIWQEAEAGRLFGARDPLLLMTPAPCAWPNECNLPRWQNPGWSWESNEVGNMRMRMSSKEEESLLL